MEFVEMQKKNIWSSLEIINIPVLNDKKITYWSGQGYKTDGFGIRSQAYKIERKTF